METVKTLSNFREAVCQKFGCSVESYADTVLSHCLYSHARIPAILLKTLDPEYFRTDYKLIDELGHCTTARQAKSRVNHYRFYGSADTFLARRLRIRVSGRRILELAADLLPEHETSLQQ